MKKNLTLLFSMIALLSSASAQIQQGNVMVGTDIANFSLSLNSGGLFSVRLNPKAAFFVRDGVALGAAVSFGLTTAKGAGNNIDYGVSALGRYYVNSEGQTDLVHKSRFFAEATVGIEGTNPASGDNTNGLGISVGPGCAYFVTSNIGLEGLLKYRGIIGFGSRATSSFVELNFGFQIYLSKDRAKRAMGRE